MERLYEYNGIKYSFITEDDLDLNFEFVGEKDGLSFYRLKLVFKEMTTPKKLKMTFGIPCIDMYGQTDFINKSNHLGVRWGKPGAGSRIASGLPIRQIYSKTNANRFLFAIEDVKNPIYISAGASELSGNMEFENTFFTDLCGPFTTYETLIRIDERDIPFYKAMEDVKKWYEEFGYVPAQTPTLAKQPMYSTWYSLWQTLTTKQVLSQCKQAIKYGMKTVIIDDGWQTAYSGDLYAHVGDWKVITNKFGQMRNLVDKLHAIGMKAMLWFSVPFMGFEAKNHKKFEGKYLYDMPENRCSVLDPRYKEVRDFTVNLYVDALKNYDLDGLKLDFIDRFKSNGKWNEQMDFVSVEDATEQLLKEITIALKAIKPDVLIEFRQPYYGPVISTYGNMMRVWDCPLDSVSNKNGTLNLRMCCPITVHSDMIYWHNGDDPENVATQLWGTLFSVPQISVRLEEISEIHKKVLKNYLDFWNGHSETLLSGDLSATMSDTGYSYAQSVKNGEQIALAINNTVFEVTQNNGYVCNLTEQTNIILKAKTNKFYYEVFDCAGGRVSRKVKVKSDLTEVYVPRGGMLKVEKI